MAQLKMRLLGPIQFFRDEESHSGLDSYKVRALLAYLAVESESPHRREFLAGLLWPEFPERSARTNLRRALANLRGIIEDREARPPFLNITRQTIQFNQDGDCWLDTAELTCQIGQ
jgi:DNA-binding SARP family transcriptional activator